MPRNATLTVRLPAPLKERLEARAEADHRSLSAQVVAELEGLTDEPPIEPGKKGRFLGLYAGTTVPSDADFAATRARLWRRLPRTNGERSGTPSTA